MKEKINKTIITKKGGTIVIPNKIIGKEYPDYSGNIDTEELAYVVKVNNLFKNYEGHVFLKGEGGVTRDDTLYYNSGHLFKDDFSVNSLDIFFIAVSAKSVMMPFIYYPKRTGFANTSGVELELNDPELSDFICKEVYFIAFDKNSILELMDNFLDDVEYETNFEV